METVLVINGEAYWQDYLPDFNVISKKIQNTQWLWKESELIAIDTNGVCVPNKILWRVGAIKPAASHRVALEMIALSQISCVNSAEVLLTGYDRISMLRTLIRSGLPVIPFQVATASTMLKGIQISFPFVVKAGNYHGGFGKALVEEEKKWQDIRDLLFISDDYITIEPFINYVRDIRYLSVGEEIWAMARKGRFWKANVETTDFELINIDPIIVNEVRQLKTLLQADIIAVDILEDSNGDHFYVEYNDIPGLSGFPDAAIKAVAQCIREK